MPTNQKNHAVSVVLRPDPGGEGPTTISVRHPTDPFMGLKVSIGTPNLPFHVSAVSENDTFDLVRAYLGWLTGMSAKKRIPELGFSLALQGGTATEDLICLPFVDQQFPWKTSFWFDRTDHTLVALAAPDPLSDDITSRCGIRVVAHYSDLHNSLLVTSMSAHLLPGAIVKIKSGTPSGQEEVGPVKQEKFKIDVIRSKEPVSQKPKRANHSISARRPTGDEKILTQYIGGPRNFDRNAVYSEVEFVRHQPSRFVRADIDSGILAENLAQNSKGLVKSAPISIRPPRSDAFAADQAYYSSNLLFDVFRRYSIRPKNYFRSAQLPLAIHYRSGMPYGSGRSGQTVNAAVQPYEPDPGRTAANRARPPNKWRRHQIAPGLCQEPPELHMHFALANLTHRGREEWKGEQRSPAQPMGIVTDPRWVWHEFGHVLLMATTGELEMRFAHSLGDALAAIISDPESNFVEDTGPAVVGERAKNRRWRGATFPWVYIPRRHDRCVKRGWSWSGAMHKPLRELPDAKQPRRKGYRSEQILSTSLFRLYLCLGGMTLNPGGLQIRQAASDYTVYLIMKGLGLLGDARIVAANHPDQLVSALIDADVGTESFKIDANDVTGGFAHKVIRWAFEAQGLYADGAVNNNDKGEPPAVDVYIKDRRPPFEHWCGGVEHDEGSYVPVPLEGPKTMDDSNVLWFTDAIEINKEGTEIHVWVGNRGSKTADGVGVRVFCAPWNGTSLPTWEGGGGNWNEVETKAGGPTTNTTQNIPKSETLDFGPYAWEREAPDANYLILAEATCDADRANTDPDSRLPCGRRPIPLVDLVANDNNLGLTLWRCPEKPSSSKDKPEDLAIPRQHA